MVASSTLLFGALLLLCAAVAVAAGRSLWASRGPGRGGPGEPAKHSPLVARQVLDAQGQALGEVLRVQGDDAVVKHGDRFLVLPAAALQEDGARLRAGAFDLAEAEAKGEAWRARQQDVMRYDDQGMPLPER